MKTFKNLFEGNIKNKTVTFMIGAPGVGKSTYISNKGLQNVLSRDDILMAHGRKMGLSSYNQIFSHVDQNAINRDLQSQFKKYIDQGKNFVIDMTLMNRKSRAKFLSQIPKDYKKIAVAFEANLDLLKKRNRMRTDQGKDLPIHVLQRMLDNYEPPSKKEGFDDIEIRKA
jgi:predicted kinase